MDVNEWMSYVCSDEGTNIHNIHNSSTRSHASEDENRTRYRSKNLRACQTAKLRLGVLTLKSQNTQSQFSCLTVC